MYQRFDENTKLIVVDGQLAVGKHEIAKEIADELGFEFFPDITLDRMYINDYGFDFRDLDYKLPEGAKCYDEKNFLTDPTHFNAASFQAIKYRLRFAQYIDCLAHLMNTGMFSDYFTPKQENFTNGVIQCIRLSKVKEWWLFGAPTVIAFSQMQWQMSATSVNQVSKFDRFVCHMP